MEFVADLWLPTALSAILVFLASSIMHMVLPIHRGDYGRLPAEADVLAAMRERKVGPGAYMFPCPGSMKEMQSPEMIEAYRRGPVGFMTVLPNGVPAIGKNLAQWFGYCLVVSVMTAYITRLALHDGDGSMLVFRITASIGVLGYVTSSLAESIWKGQAWSTTAKFILDGVIYAVVMGLTFMWLWP